MNTTTKIRNSDKVNAKFNDKVNVSDDVNNSSYSTLDSVLSLDILPPEILRLDPSKIIDATGLCVGLELSSIVLPGPQPVTMDWSGDIN